MISEPRIHRGLHRDQRGLVTGLVLRILIPLALLGLIGYEGGQILIAQVRAQSISRVAATAGADTYYRTKRADLAKKDATAAALREDASAMVTDVEILSDGSCRVTVTKKAKTLLVQRIGVLKKYSVQLATDDEIRTS